MKVRNKVGRSLATIILGSGVMTLPGCASSLGTGVLGGVLGVSSEYNTGAAKQLAQAGSYVARDEARNQSTRESGTTVNIYNENVRSSGRVFVYSDTNGNLHAEDHEIRDEYFFTDKTVRIGFDLKNYPLGTNIKMEIIDRYGEVGLEVENKTTIVPNSFSHIGIRFDSEEGDIGLWELRGSINGRIVDSFLFKVKSSK